MKRKFVKPSFALQTGPPHALREIMLDRLGCPDVVVGVDIETHDWRDDACNKGHIGQFGWYTMRDDASLEFARLVQLGYAIGKAGVEAPAVVKSTLIKPNGFEISVKATRECHGITHEQASREGRDLKGVLQEFMKDVSEACGRGGRICAHQSRGTADFLVGDLVPRSAPM